MRLYVKCSNLESSNVIPYLGMLVRKTRSKLYTDERCEVGTLKFNKLGASTKNYVTMEVDGDLLTVDGNSFVIGKFIDISQFKKVPVLGEHKFEIDGNKIKVIDSEKVVAIIVDNEADAIKWAMESVIVLTGTGIETYFGTAFNIANEDDKIRWCSKFCTMPQTEYDYILQLQRALICNKYNLKPDYDKMMDTLFR